MNRVIVVGSPRVDGRSASLADELLYACIEECPDDGVSIVSVASTDVRPCTGCDACARALGAAPDALEEGDPLWPHPSVEKSDAALHRCVIDDDMAEVRKHLDAADELIVVSPVYFASVPAQFKCLLDRLQPYFRSDVRTRAKRPLILHVVGEGGDPHGFDPLVGTVRSAFSVAGFQLEAVFDWVGAIDADGAFVGDPREYPVPPAGPWFAAGADAAASGAESVADEPGACGEDEGAAVRQMGGSDAATAATVAAPRPASGKEKPRLSLAQPAKGAKGKRAKAKGPSDSGRGSASEGKRRGSSDGRGGQRGSKGDAKAGRPGSAGGRRDERGGKGGARKGGRRG
ncbi:MAG TPA: NAD(P)H-dependent oxidoreductase [Candidatus Aphodovivens avistercoris]|nr:NAD(P)H-dependent oxidoreductase [Candidatus Aphodovivens avistercoris]